MELKIVIGLSFCIKVKISVIFNTVIFLVFWTKYFLRYFRNFWSFDDFLRKKFILKLERKDFLTRDWVIKLSSRSRLLDHDYVTNRKFWEFEDFGISNLNKSWKITSSVHQPVISRICYFIGWNSDTSKYHLIHDETYTWNFESEKIRSDSNDRMFLSARSW